MTTKEFQNRISCESSENGLAQLAYDVIEDSLGEPDTREEVMLLPKRISSLLDSGLNPNVLVDGEVCISGLQYGYTGRHLYALKLILEKCGAPTALDNENVTFLDTIQSRITIDYYNFPPVVRMFLLTAAYSEEDIGIRMSPNLDKAMFDNIWPYISSDDSQGHLVLEKSIFKNIRKYDFCVEMQEQKKGYIGCWRLHIFDIKNRIEVATYE